MILQDSFQVWDPKTLIRKGRERHLFLFEMSLIFSKEVKDSNGRSKYIYKSKLFVRPSSECPQYWEYTNYYDYYRLGNTLYRDCDRRLEIMFDIVIS